jgi:predicted XRE-type DNA-binding protein
MTAKELIKTLMLQEEISNAEMARKLNITQAALWDRLNSKKTDNMTVGRLIEMLNHLDYELVVRKIDGSEEHKLSI